MFTPAISSGKRGRRLKPAAQSRTTAKERKCSNKREWSDGEKTKLINLWKLEKALYNSECGSFSDCDKRKTKATKVQITEKLNSDFHLRKKNICFDESPLRMMKNALYFFLKAFFVLKIFKILS